MALPAKSTKIDLRSSHLQRTLPALLEQWLGDQGYVVRAMSSERDLIVRMSAEGCKPLSVGDLAEIIDPQVEAAAEATRDLKDGKIEKEDCERRQYFGPTVQALVDATLAGGYLENEEDGTFHRGDLLLYVQGEQMRQQIRDAREIERIERESEEHVFEQIDEFNKHLQAEAKGLARVGPGLTGADEGIAPPSAHASGGLAELNRTREGQSMAERLSGT